MFLGVAVVSFTVGLMVTMVRGGATNWVHVDPMVTYWRHGFVRRGLLGSVLAPVTRTAGDLQVVLVAVSIVGAVALAAVTLVLLRRLGDGGRCTLVVAAVPLFAQLGWDLGRTDGLLLALLVGVCLLLMDDRPVPAAALLAIGGLVHELVLLFGVALLVAAARQDLVAPRRTVPPLLVAASAGMVLLSVGRFEGSSEEFLGRLPAYVPQAFGSPIPRTGPWTGSPVEGMEGVATYLATPQGVVGLVVLVTVAAVCTRVLVRRTSAPTALALLVPAVLLASVAIDHPRWAFWLLVHTGLVLAMADRVPAVPDEAVGAAIGVLLGIGPLGVVAPFPYWAGAG